MSYPRSLMFCNPSRRWRLGFTERRRHASAHSRRTSACRVPTSTGESCGAYNCTTSGDGEMVDIYVVDLLGMTYRCL